VADRQHIPAIVTPTFEGVQAWVRQAATILNARIDDAVNIGQMRVFFGDIEMGWLACDGSEVSRETYSALFDVIGTTYGEGDGTTTFNLPNRKLIVTESDASLDALEATTETVAIRTE
jgi:hypothetical protein